MTILLMKSQLRSDLRWLIKGRPSPVPIPVVMVIVPTIPDIDCAP
jgi:hypothetical protein